jgi:hypothetical protein
LDGFVGDERSLAKKPIEALVMISAAAIALLVESGRSAYYSTAIRVLAPMLQLEFPFQT